MPRKRWEGGGGRLIWLDVIVASSDLDSPVFSAIVGRGGEIKHRVIGEGITQRKVGFCLQAEVDRATADPFNGSVIRIPSRFC